MPRAVGGNLAVVYALPVVSALPETPVRVEVLITALSVAPSLCYFFRPKQKEKPPCTSIVQPPHVFYEEKNCDATDLMAAMVCCLVASGVAI